MRLVNLVTATAIFVSMSVASLDAQQGGPKGPSSKAPKTASAPKAPKTIASTSNVATKPAKAPSTVTAKATKSAAKADAKLARAETKSVKKSGTTTTTTSTTTNTSTSSATTSPTPTTIDFTKGAVAERLTKNTALRTKLETRLGTLGYTGTVYQAAYGFRNQGQFVAATNAAQNLGVTFDQIKLQMTGLSVDATGTVLRANLASDGTITMVPQAEATNPMPTKSLGQSIKTVRSSVDATAAAQTATTQADADIASTVSN